MLHRSGERKRLEYGDHTLVVHCLGSLQGGGQLGGMVGVVVRNGHAVHGALDLEASAGATEIPQPFSNLCKGQSHAVTGSNGCQCIEDVVLAWYLEGDFAQSFAVLHNGKRRPGAGEVLDLHRTVIHTLAASEGNHLLALDTLNCLEGIGVVAVVNDGLACHRSEGMEGLDDVFEGAEVVEVIGIDIQDDGGIGFELEVVIHELAGLTHENIARSHAAAAVNRRELAADDRRQVNACIHKDLGQHRGGRGLAVGAGDTDRITIPTGNQTQHLASLQHRHTGSLGSNQFRIVRHDRSCMHDQVSAFDIFRTLSEGLDFDAHVPDCLQCVRFVVIGTGQMITLRMKDLRQWVHSRTADADKMNVLLSFQNGFVHKIHLISSYFFHMFLLY